MDSELEKKLFSIEPGWFNRSDIQRSAMCWGIECGNGWFNILKFLLQTAKNREESWDMDRDYYEELLSKGEDPPKHLKEQFGSLELRNPFKPGVFEITQIKEKYAGLCFYYRGGTEDYDNIVRAMEGYSYCVCEICGQETTLLVHEDGHEM